MQRRSTSDIKKDSGATFFTSTPSDSTLQNFQFRIGGRYYPAAPVQCSLDTGSDITNGAAEAYIELAKALNVVGDYRLSSNVNVLRWGLPSSQGGQLSEYDYSKDVLGYSPKGRPILIDQNDFTGTASAFSQAGALGSQCFCMATALETTNGIEISGLNAEEQVIR